MSDRYLIEPICAKCKADLNEEGLPLFMGDEDEPLILKCPKCKAKTMFWVETKTKSKLTK
jgi:DNA-directed RNA polymerase subunit RPC12/RpoP